MYHFLAYIGPASSSREMTDNTSSERCVCKKHALYEYTDEATGAALYVKLDALGEHTLFTIVDRRLACQPIPNTPALDLPTTTEHTASKHHRRSHGPILLICCPRRRHRSQHRWYRH